MAEKRNILFVDDEPRILEGLQNLLRKQRHEWNMVFANGPDAACAELEKRSFDVIVSDMRMPKMDGATLLAEVQRKYPATVRIILTGQTDTDATRRSVTVAHQFLAKPCEGEMLKRVIQRTCELQELLFDPALRAAVGQIGQLPPAPHLFAELSAALDSPCASTKLLAEIVERDPSMAAKVLQMVNSAFFGLGTKTGTIAQAINYLGIDVLKGLMLLMHAAGGKNVDPGLIRDLQRHSMLTARISAAIVKDGSARNEAFTAGLLADLGRLIIATGMRDQFRQASDLARETGRPLHEVERELIGFAHAEIGAYFLGLWNLPYPIVEAVAHHHRPRRIVTDKFDLVAVLHIADALAEAATVGDGTSRLDLELIAQLGLSGEIPRWVACARAEIDGLERRSN